MSTGAGMFQGAASGAASGAAFGPWGALAGGVIGGVSGLLGSRAAKKEAERAAAEDRERRAAQAWAAGEYNRLGNEFGEQSKFVPTGVRTAYGTAQMDPETGMMTGTLDPRYAGYSDQWNQLFQSEFGRMMNFDPQALAAERFKQTQGLVLPGREEQLDRTQGMMLRRGLIGSAATDATGRATNPLYQSLARAWGEEDTRQALEAQGFADQRRVQGLGLLSGMMGQIQGIDALSERPLNQSFNWSGTMNAHNLAALGTEYDLYGRGVGAGMLSRMPASFVREAQNNRTATNAAGASSFMNQLPGMFSMFRGGFGGGGGIGGGGNGPDNPYGIGSWNMNN